MRSRKVDQNHENHENPMDGENFNSPKRESDLDLGTENPLKRLKPTDLLNDSQNHLGPDLESLVSDADPGTGFLHPQAGPREEGDQFLHVPRPTAVNDEKKEISGLVDRVVLLERRKPSFGEIKAMSLPELRQELAKLDMDIEDEKEVLMGRLIEALGLGKTFLCPWESCDGAFDEPSAMESHIKTDHMSLHEDKMIALPNTDLPLPGVPANSLSNPQQIVQIITDKHPPREVRRLDVVPDDQQKERQKINMLQRKRNAVARKIYKNLGSQNGVHSFQFDHKFRQSELFDAVFDTVPTETKADKGTQVKVYTTKQQILDQFGKQWVDKIFSLRYGSEVVNTTLDAPLFVELDQKQRELHVSGKYTANQKQLRSLHPTDRALSTGGAQPGSGDWKAHIVRLW